MQIPDHISSSYIQNCFKSTSVNKSKSSKKLASGYRINTAADDAAKLSISEKMRAQIRGLDQASNNIQDSISFLQVADGALETVSAITQRIRELAVQSANDTYTDQDRAQMQQECDQLQAEMLSIFEQSAFHSKKIFTGPNLTPDKEISKFLLKKQLPIFDSEQIIDGKLVPADTLNMIVQVLRLTEISKDLEERFGSELTRENCTIPIISYQLEFIQYAKKLNGYGEKNGYKQNLIDAETNLKKALHEKEIGGIWRDYFDLGGSYLAAAYGNSENVAHRYTDALLGLAYIITATGQTPQYRSAYIYNTISPTILDALSDYDKANLKDTHLYTLLKQKPPAYNDIFKTLVDFSGMKEISFFLQNGANADQGIKLQVIIPGIPKSPFGLSSHGSANATMDRADQFLIRINAMRAEIGAYQNRLESSLSYAAYGAEALQDTESRMRDANMAKETADYLKTKLQNEFQLSFLAQKNASGTDASILSFPG